MGEKPVTRQPRRTQSPRVIFVLDSVISILNAIVTNSVITSLRYLILLTTVIGRYPFPKFGVQIQSVVLCGCQVRGESRDLVAGV